MGLWLRLGVTAAALLSVAAACGDSVTSNPATGGAGSGAGSAAGSANGGAGGGGGLGGAPTASECHADAFWLFDPDYDQFNPTIGRHCMGTDHQDIEGVEKLVFLGDSVTFGTPPTPASDYYRTLLGNAMTDRFPGLEVDSCAENGARVGDLLSTQIPSCFPDAEPKKTLVVMTMGGNDVIQWPQDGLTVEEATADADDVAAEFRRAIEWFDDATRFPNGVFVVFANIYEFTDGSAELSACPGANFLNLPMEYIDGAPALAHLNEQYMRIAVDTGRDMIFKLEEFCGHGWRRENENSTCYRGPDAELWFDITCIHPTPLGHHALAGIFQAVIEE